MNAILETKVILTFASTDPERRRPHGCAVPGDPPAWFASPDARDTYARAMSQKTGLPVKSRYLNPFLPN